MEIRRNVTVVCLEQLNMSLNESDPEMEYLCAPGILHRVEKRSCRGNTSLWCAWIPGTIKFVTQWKRSWNGIFLRPETIHRGINYPWLKSDPQMEIRWHCVPGPRIPGTIHRVWKTISEIQKNSQVEIRHCGVPGTILRILYEIESMKAILKWNIFAPWNNSSLWKTVLIESSDNWQAQYVAHTWKNSSP